MTNLTGSAAWIFKDFATPLRPENPIPKVNQKGVEERDGTPKESYYVFQSYWSDHPMIHIYGHSWPVRWGKPGEDREVKVFSNCDLVELFVNGVSAGKKQRDIKNFPASGLSWSVKLNDGDNTLTAVGTKEGKSYTDEIHQKYQSTPWEKPDKLVLTEITRSNNLVTVEIKALDKNGVQCLDAANTVRFGITGDGALIDNLGTSTSSRVVQMYNGRAEIGIRCTGPRSIVSVSSGGLTTAFLDIK